MRDGPAHIPVLDGIRGVAILLVVLHHFTLYGGFEPQTTFDRLTSLLAAASRSGVDLFFVLSGFLITRILYAAERDRNYFRKFYIRRTLRIFPLYYATLAFFFLAGPLLIKLIGFHPFGLDEPYEALLADQGWYWSYLINFQIALHGWPEFNALAHFWSLAIEEQFYLAWPLLVYFLGRANLVRFCVFLIVFSLALRMQLAWNGEFLAAYVLAPARLDALAVGALLALLSSRPDGLAAWRRAAWCAGGASAAGLAVIAIWRRGLWIEDAVTITVGLTLFACLFGSALVLAVTSPQGGILHRTLTSGPLTSLGRYSYGMYVFHHPISMFMGRLVGVADLPLVAGSQVPALAVYMLVGGGISLAIAAASWHLFEQRFLKLKQRFTRS